MVGMVWGDGNYERPCGGGTKSSEKKKKIESEGDMETWHHYNSAWHGPIAQHDEAFIFMM